MTMTKFKTFLKRKDIEFSSKRYLQDALSAMALGLFASLLIGLIIKIIGQQSVNLLGETQFSSFMIETGTGAMALMGPAIGVAVAWGLKSPPLVLFASVFTGSIGAVCGGPAGAFVASAIATEFGKAISKETKVDIIVTPVVTIMVGALVASFVGEPIGSLMTGLGSMIMRATEWQPFFFGIFISVVVGLALTAPISSAALCMMLGLSGLAAGAATVGCSAQMIGFAIMSYKENGFGGFIAQGLGTSMLQISNIIKNPWIIVPPTLTAAILGPVATVLFKMENNSMGAGMGTSGLVGQIGTFASMGFSNSVAIKVMVIHIVLPAVLTLTIYHFLKKMGKIKFGDCKLDI